MLGLLGPLAPAASPLTAALVALVPGLLLGRTLGLAWRWTPLLAPALSAAVLGGWAALGGPVTWLGAGAATVLAPVLAAALARWAAACRRGGPPRADAPVEPAPALRAGDRQDRSRQDRSRQDRSRQGLALAAAGAVCAAAALTVVLARAGARLGAVNQLWDAAWHANLTRFLVETADGRPSAAGRLVGAGWRHADTWYPTGLHVESALTDLAASQGVAASLDAVVALHAVVVLPLTVAALVWVLGGELPGRGGAPMDDRARGAGAGVAAVVAVLPTAFPLDRVWRPAWPMTVSFVLALVAVLALVVCVREARRGAMTPAGAAVLPLACAAGAGLVHPCGVVVVGLVGVGWACGRVLAQQGRARARGLLALAGLLLLGSAATLLARAHVDAVASVFAYDYRLDGGLRPALAAVAGLSAPVVEGTGYGVPQDGGQPLAGALVAAGALACALTPGARWLAGLWVVLVLAALETFTPVLAPLALVTGWFFNVESRLVALVAMVGALAVGVGVVGVASRLLAAWPAAASRTLVITLPDASVAREPAGATAGATAGAMVGVMVGARVGDRGGLRVMTAGEGPVGESSVGEGAVTRADVGAASRRPAPGSPPASLTSLVRGAPPRAVLVLAAAAQVTVLVAVGLSSAERARPRVAAAWSGRVVDEDAAAVMDALARQPLPRGGRILNDPLDGSPWLYALTGTMPMFTHYDDRNPRGDARTLLDGLDRADSDPGVRAALDALSVCYVYDAPTLVSDAEVRPEGFVGLAGVASLQPVARSGGVVAYAVLPPPPGCAPR